MKPSVFIVEDKQDLTQMLADYLDRAGEFRFAGSAVGAKAAFADILANKPDIALIDVRLGEESGIGLMRDILAHTEVRVVLMSAHHDHEAFDLARQAGALGYVRKGNPEEILQALRSALAGEWFVSPGLVDALARIPRFPGKGRKG